MSALQVAHITSHRPWLYSELGKESFGSNPKRQVHMPGSDFSRAQSSLVSGEGQSISLSSGTAPLGHVTEIQDVSHITGTDCISAGGHPIQIPAHVAIPALGFIAPAEPNPP